MPSQVIVPASAAGDTLLAYQLAIDPDPIQAGRTCGLRLTARGGDAPAYCRKIVISMPTGTGSGHLTNTPTGITIMPVRGGDHPDQGDGWSVERTSATGRVDFTATPSSAAGWLPGVTPLTLGLDDIAVNGAVGVAALQVSEESSLDGVTWQTRTTRLSLPKFPEDFVFKDFRPDHVLVLNGGHAVLSWRGSPATYTLTWGGESGGMGGSADVSGVDTWTSPPLHDTTAFRLAATLPGGTAERVLTTLVTVARPHLTVNDLSAKGSIRLMGANQPIEPLGLGSTHTFVADTDGTLIGRLAAVAGGSPAVIDVTVTAEDGSIEYKVSFASDNGDTGRLPTETPFHLPVRHGTTVTATCGYLQPPATPEPLDPFFALTWVPDGNAIRIQQTAP
ncbi:hypothetical protein [Streptosporangium sp. NPDC000396]|uniref:hypothetical protein n=1 Tax=Streptosporangium sp. NPDC000396 TaxID=3366185 RepID=UPI0036A31EA6